MSRTNDTNNPNLPPAAALVRGLLHTHFGPAHVTPADVQTVQAALTGQTDLSMRNCLALAQAAGVTWTPRQMQETRDNALFAAMRAHVANKQVADK